VTAFYFKRDSHQMFKTTIKLQQMLKKNSTLGTMIGLTIQKIYEYITVSKLKMPFVCYNFKNVLMMIDWDTMIL